MAEPLKLLFLNYEYPPIGGGGGTTSQFLAEQMADRGHEVQVLTGGIPGRLGIEKPRPRLTIERLYTTRKRADLSRKREMIAYILHAAFLFRRRMKTLSPHLIHVFFSFPTGGVLWPHRFGLKVPYLVSLLGGDVPGFLPEETSTYHRLIQPFTAGLWQQAHAIVANSTRLGALAEKVCDVPISVIYNGVDTRVFHNRGAVPKDAPPRLLFAGRLVPQKGMDILLEALGREKGNLGDWRLTAVGEGPERARCEARARELAIADRIDWRGWVPLETLPDIYRAHQVFVLPSRFEGMPSVVAQAMACGCVAIATDVFGAEEQIGDTGHIVPVEDPATLGNRLRTTLNDPNLRARREAAARRAALFDSKLVADRYETLYRECAARSRPT